MKGRAGTGSADRPRRTRVHDLIGARVVESDGRTIGRVMDLELEHTDGFDVVALELARNGLPGRLGITRMRSWLRHDQHRPVLVPWSSVASFRDGTVRLVPGAPPPTEGGATPTGPASGERVRRTGRKDKRSTIREVHR